MGLALEVLERPLNLIYEAALEPARWHEALAEVSTLIGAGCFHLCGWNSETHTDGLGVIMSPHWQPALELYVERFADDDPRVRVANALGDHSWMVCAEHFGEREVSRGEIWQELLVPWGLRYTLCNTFARSGPNMVVAAFMRDTQPFQPEQVAAAQFLLPHFQRASALMLRGWSDADRRQLDGAAGELTHLGLLALTAAGQLVHANRRGESLLREQVLLKVQAGHVRASEVRADARLQAAIKIAASGGSPRHLTLRSGGKTAWITVMQPSATHAVPLPGQRVRALCLIADDQSRLASGRQLMEAFGLSPAEARIARELALGGSLEACARETGVSRNTVKTQLANALAKMGLSDQRQLIRLMARLPAVRD